jgi:hypothetical protein
MIIRLKLFLSFIFITNIYLNSAFCHEIYLANGKMVKVKNYWDNGDSVCYEKFGATISIPRPDILKIVHEESAKDETNTTSVHTSITPPLPVDNITPKNSKYIGSGNERLYNMMKSQEAYLLEVRNWSEQEWRAKQSEYQQRTLNPDKRSLEEFREGKLKFEEKTYLRLKESYERSVKSK